MANQWIWVGVFWNFSKYNHIRKFLKTASGGSTIYSSSNGEFTAGYTYFANGNNATSGNVSIRPYHTDCILVLVVHFLMLF